MPIRRHPDLQLAYQPRLPGHSSIHGQLVQAASIAYASTWAGLGIGRDERYREEYGFEDLGWKGERKFEAKGSRWLGTGC